MAYHERHQSMSKFSDTLQLYPHSIAFSSTTEDNSNNSYDHFKPLYEIANRCLAEGYAVIYGAEYIDKSEETLHQISTNITRASLSLPSNINNETSKDIERGLLMIVDANSSYSDERDGIDIVSYWLANFTKAKKNLHDKSVKGLVAINIPDPYLSRDKHNIFMKFEAEIGKSLGRELGLICWYDKKWINDLSFRSLISILTTHSIVLHANFQYQRWGAKRIVDVTKKVIDREYEKDTSTLLFQTIMHAHHLSMESLVMDPEKLEKVLYKAMGNDEYYNVVQPAILQELKKEVSCDDK
jgi:hypothetical protein